ncbi:uncharacterized protein MELLADRAFT_85646 [Melampsora larici-populina 98AG31]|uniref:Uncharacterized protein n=1 Tax=Melampsora larici-populina (strain 98AG31 / pathotype 3-4-7) TaxID=747676 RepID=F4RJA7_MELLP|nr:uncharacterized protein MELLADRAFT_85646 [Melampsora larici-populina 98AG31]EGG07532.1 hypothetical protein MELLADRAFT_85646 [Melampsora larici-populina 98AG31]
MWHYVYIQRTKPIEISTTHLDSDPRVVSPGVSKQMMLDWMHINHPKIPIRPRIDPVGLAELVRSVQPEYFPNPATDKLACTTASASSIEASILTDQPTTTTMEIRSSTSTSRYPKLQSLEELQDSKPFQPPTPPFFKLNTVGRQGKRVASSEVKQSPKSSELGSDIRRISSKTSKKKKITHSSQTVTKPTKSTGDSVHPSIQPSSPGHINSNTSLTFEHDEKDLKDLHDSLAMPALPSQGAITKLHVPKRNAMKPSPILDHIEPRIVPQQPAYSESTEIKDLIDFSDTDCMDIGNQVLGKDIPPISPTTVIGKKRSGVDVFKEERGREARICQLEKSIAQILEEVGQLSADVLQAKTQLEVQEHKIQILKTDQECLKKTANITSTLHPQVTHLEIRVDTLRRKVDTDHEEIVTHGHILEKLMASDDEEDESSD